MTNRALLLGLMLLAFMAVACSPWAERQRMETQLPVERPEILADILLPDFQVEKMTAQDQGSRWLFTVWVRNTGGNQGILDEPSPAHPEPQLTAKMNLVFNVLECLGPGDTGSDDFECVNPRSRARQPVIGVPLAGQSRRRHFYWDHLHPWQIWLMAIPTTLSNEPILEKDYPSRLNNQALLKIVFDPERSSWNPATRTWTWPNDEDTLPL